MAILITGGAGYIGSHAVKALKRAGREVVVYDNLSTGYAAAVQGAPLIQGDLIDQDKLMATIREYGIDGVMHFAAFSLVGESMQQPAKYYTNNVAGTLSLIEALRKTDIKRMIFSSTAAVYGQPDQLPITEQCTKNPTNVYGRTKLVLENMLADYQMAYGLNSISLRYFNAAGADASGEIGEAHNPETHLIPNIIRVLLGKADHFDLYGTDYQTDDGTCVRDYIHVTDLIDAHVLALHALEGGAKTTAYNLGNGNGFSNRQIIESVERVSGKSIPVRECPRRAGDPATLVASSERARTELGWKPKLNDIDSIVASAIAWHTSHPNGYSQ